MWQMWGAGARMWKCRGKTSAQAKSKSNGQKPRGQTFVKVGNPGCHFLAVNAGRARHSRNRIGPALRLLGEGGAAGCGCHGSRAKLQNNREILSPQDPHRSVPVAPHACGWLVQGHPNRERGNFFGGQVTPMGRGSPLRLVQVGQLLGAGAPQQRGGENTWEGRCQFRGVPSRAVLSRHPWDQGFGVEPGEGEAKTRKGLLLKRPIPVLRGKWPKREFKCMYTIPHSPHPQPLPTPRPGTWGGFAPRPYFF